MNKDFNLTYKKAVTKSLKNILGSLPIMFSILLLVNLISLFGKDYYSKLFNGNLFLDPFVGALAGSLSFGIPVTSYIVGGELLKDGVSLIAVTAFILTWTTVGLLMLPLESKFLGKKFALIRNLTNFAFSVIIALLTVVTLNIFS